MFRCLLGPPQIPFFDFCCRLIGLSGGPHTTKRDIKGWCIIGTLSGVKSAGIDGFFQAW